MLERMLAPSCNIPFQFLGSFGQIAPSFSDPGVPMIGGTVYRIRTFKSAFLPCILSFNLAIHTFGILDVCILSNKKDTKRSDQAEEYFFFLIWSTFLLILALAWLLHQLHSKI
ncbi:hypothetical protein CW304_27865 [Bacillus sp. UFRGS-B20]|nr:hypothetical protein CW304_27865 [Bacillus sp. UFRGS-B20]